MSLKIFQRKIDDTSQTGGTGNLTCDGPAGAGNQGVDYLGQVANNGDQIVLVLTDQAGNFEVSQCTVTISGATVSFSRDTVVASSNSGNKVNFGSAVVKISNYIPATLELVLFNLTFQSQAQASLSQLVSDVTDTRDALELILANS